MNSKVQYTLEKQNYFFLESFVVTKCGLIQMPPTLPAFPTPGSPFKHQEMTWNNLSFDLRLTGNNVCKLLLHFVSFTQLSQFEHSLCSIMILFVSNSFLVGYYREVIIALKK